MTVKSSIRDGVARVTVEGRFNFDIHAKFKAASQEAFAEPGTKTIEIHLFDVDYMDSSALGMLLVLKDQAHKAGIRDLVLVGARGSVRQVLEVARFDKFYTMR